MEVTVLKLKKINRGLILTILVLLGVAIYLATLQAGRARDRDALNALCAKYLPVYAESVKLSPADCELEPAGFNDRLTQLQSAAKQTQLEWFVNEKCFEPTLVQLENIYTAQNGQKSPVTQCDLKIKSVGNFQFDGDVAITTVKYSVSYQGPVNIYDKISNGNIEKDYDMESKISFQKIDGNWKIYYFDGSIFSF